MTTTKCSERDWLMIDDEYLWYEFSIFKNADKPVWIYCVFEQWLGHIGHCLLAEHRLIVFVFGAWKTDRLTGAIDNKSESFWNTPVCLWSKDSSWWIVHFGAELDSEMLLKNHLKISIATFQFYLQPIDSIICVAMHRVMKNSNNTEMWLC